eukprot:gene15295-21379_t
MSPLLPLEAVVFESMLVAILVSSLNLSWNMLRYQDNLGGYVLSEERRHENVKFGYPDDGYDYLAHLKSMGAKTATGTEGKNDLANLKSMGPKLATGTEANRPPSYNQPSEAASTSGDGATEEEVLLGGPSVFVQSTLVVKPEDDMRLVDARKLAVRERVADEEEALKSAATLSPDTIGKGKLLNDLADLEETMLRLEGREDKLADGGEGYEGDDWGEWMDEFVVKATKEDSKSVAALPADEDADDGGESEECEDDDEDGGNEVSGMPTRPKGFVGPAMSIASSYWRNERNDRKGLLVHQDEHFENVAAQYDEDVLGELDDEQAATARGTANLSDFTNILDDFLREQKEAEGREDEGGALPHGPHEPGFGEGSVYSDEEDASVIDEKRYRPTRGSRKAANMPLPPNNKVISLAEIDREVIELTKARLHQEEERSHEKETAASTSKKQIDPLATPGVHDEEEDRDKFDIGPEWYEGTGHVMMPEDDKWDCESVSNMENHPGRIVEPQKRTGGKGGGTIKLSNKTGVPTGYTPSAVRKEAAPGLIESKLKAVREDGTAVMGVLTEGTQNAVEKEGIAGLDAITEGTAALSTSDQSDGGHFDDEDDDEELEDERPAAIIIRNKKGETAEEKKIRKASVKAARKDNRTTKKMVKSMFKEEGGRQKKQAAGKSAAAPGLSTFVLP